MKQTNTAFVFSDANGDDIASILEEAKKLDLDCQAINEIQFVVCKRENQLIGFGRLIQHSGFSEVATVGVVAGFRNLGIGEELVNKLIQKTNDDLFVVTVIPEYFKTFGFEPVKEFSEVFRKKINFCKDYHFEDEEIKVMKLKR